MNISEEKLRKLIEVSRLYYEQNKTQNEIAALYQVSRPLISRMLQEARDYGIVKIEICSPLEQNQGMKQQLCSLFGIKGGAFVQGSGNDNFINDQLSKAAIEYMTGLEQDNYGIGWGHIIGNTVSYMEQREPIKGLGKRICPLIGNSGVGNRNYHSNELVRIFSLQTGAAPEYLYAPALVSSKQELSLMRGLENFRSVQNAWENLQVALVNIGNYPSTPDFASAARYGSMLTTQKAVGRMLGYFFDINGTVFHSENDYMLQIPLENLSRIPHVVGICSANTNPRAVLGALRSGYINHLIAHESAVQAVLEQL